MKLSPQNLQILLLHLHKTIAETADQVATGLMEQSNQDTITYPPNGGLEAAEVAALQTIPTNDVLQSGLRKVIADACAAVVFDMLCLMDGVSEPDLAADQWQGLRFVDDSVEFEDSDEMMLHDQFYESYWEWHGRNGEAE